MMFERIQADKVALGLWQKATLPSASKTSAKRVQWVNARIGRFCKHLIGWASKKPVVLPKDAGKLIKGYTKLKP